MSFSFVDMAQDSRSSGSTPKPNYNKHFPRIFLLSYGEALEGLPDDEILARLKHWNCKWLSRPNIAMSEMASTLKDNWEQITRYKSTGLTTTLVNQLETFCAPIMSALRRLDNKDRYCHDPPDKDDILDVIEAIHKDGFDDEHSDETITGPSRRRPRPNILDDENEEDDDQEPFNTPESSAEHALFITQHDPEPYHEPGTLSCSQKGKAPVGRKRATSSTNIWASFGLSADEACTSAANPAHPTKKRATAGRGRGTRGTTRRRTRGRARGTPGKRGQATERHIYFD